MARGRQFRAFFMFRSKNALVTMAANVYSKRIPTNRSYNSLVEQLVSLAIDSQDQEPVSSPGVEQQHHRVNQQTTSQAVAQ